VTASLPQVAPIVAAVWKIQVVVGEAVRRGDTLAVLESMKMEIPVLAAIAGVVESIPVVPGQIVQEGDPVVILAPSPPVEIPTARGMDRG
jgi:biotin carboxyl carrier protein